MKKHEITPALDALKNVKMNKIEDKSLKKALVDHYVTLVKEKRKLDDDLAALKQAHLSPYEQEQQKVSDLQAQLQTETDRSRQVELAREINSHKELFAAIRDFNKAAEELGKDEISLPGLPQEKFIEEMDKQGFELGLLDAVYPMFN